MSSREVLSQYLLGNQLTSQITLEEFQKIASKSLGYETSAVVSKEKMEEWYEAYQERDRIERESIKSRVDQFLKRIERDELCKLETSQLKESFTLEELVDNLYTVDQVLDSKLEALNSSFEATADVFGQFSDILAKANQRNREWDEDLVDRLAEYRKMLQTETNLE
ncbi:hypothetical protein HG536_0C03740 [Torulaspora globosa]|uniref:Uncharacterized protein n=1 Tax=Torulaspora globosa TaxID=48254 RepID=A0A7G3ZFB9_9SACH|nr:uncharacterized protein HG536_0C03740 [Torulaspora globosa]QLL32205.1 hypothetical protein HG536_0C03740 [Torulaspora globosa]